MNTVSRRACWAVGLFPVALLWATWFGCGAGEYRDRLSNRVGRLSAESGFNRLNPAVSLGPRVTVRIPKIFGNQPSECAVAERIALPDLRVSEKPFVCEAMLPLGDDEAEGKAGCYLHLWVFERSGGNLGIAFAQWLNGKVAENARADFKESRFKSELGNERAWQVVEGQWSQPFFCQVNKTGQMQEKDGRVALYAYENEGRDLQIVMMVRAPKAMWEKQNLKALADQTAGCITIKPLAPPSP